MTFRSNDKLDGNGFKAYYKFNGPGGVKNRTDLIEFSVKDSAGGLEGTFLVFFVVHLCMFAFDLLNFHIHG